MNADLIVFVLFYGSVICGIVLVIIGVSEPGKNSLTRFAEKICKKYFPAIVIALVLAIPAGAWAEERSALISEPELEEIHAVARAAYPRGARVDMVVSYDIFGIFATLEFFTRNDQQYLRLDVFPAQAAVVIREAGSEEIAKKAGEKIAEAIERLLNRTPNVVLKREEKY